MCHNCDRPAPDREEYLERLRTLVARNRFTAQSVLGSATSAEFSYSIGLTAHGLPELIVTALRPQQAGRLIVVAASYLLDEALVLPGELMVCGPYVMEAIEVERPHEHLLLATELYGDGVRALQLAWADSRGVWPWEPGHRARRTGQPLLGRRAPQYCEEHRPDRLDVPPHL